jgi:L-ascorbate 6-phosphate lactonase
MQAFISTGQGEANMAEPTVNKFYSARVEPGSLGILALGQSGFLFKNATGVTVAIDPCLADPVGKLRPDWKRLYPAPLEPPELRCDILIATHDHLDHLDPDTISGLGDSNVGKFVGPRNACKHFAELGIPAERIVRVDAAETVELKGVQIGGTLAITNDPSHPDAEGIILNFPDAPSLYHTGDTSFSPLLANVAKEKPDIYMPCINGRYGNMNLLEAALLGAALRCPWAIPHHYDMFKHNLVNPEDFKSRLARFAPETTCVVLKPGEMTVITGGDE